MTVKYIPLSRTNFTAQHHKYHTHPSHTHRNRPEATTEVLQIGPKCDGTSGLILALWRQPGGRFSNRWGGRNRSQVARYHGDRCSRILSYNNMRFAESAKCMIFGQSAGADSGDSWPSRGATLDVVQNMRPCPLISPIAALLSPCTIGHTLCGIHLAWCPWRGVGVPVGVVGQRIAPPGARSAPGGACVSLGVYPLLGVCPLDVAIVANSSRAAPSVRDSHVAIHRSVL